MNMRAGSRPMDQAGRRTVAISLFVCRGGAKIISPSRPRLKPSTGGRRCSFSNHSAMTLWCQFSLNGGKVHLVNATSELRACRFAFSSSSCARRTLACLAELAELSNFFVEVGIAQALEAVVMVHVTAVIDHQRRPAVP